MIYDNYNGSGVIPIIKINNKFYFILFQSVIRKKNKENIIEDSGGKLEDTNIKISAIRELKEESSLLFNLENFNKDEDIKNLNYVLTNYNISINNLDKKKYLSCFVYLKEKNNEFNLEDLQKEFKSNMRELWKNGFSFYTENKNIVFIPINNIYSLKKDSLKIKDYLDNEYYIYERTLHIFLKLIKKNVDIFINELDKFPIILEKKLLDKVDLNQKYILNNIISYS